MKSYDHQKIEKKWQAYWEKKKLNVAKDGDKRKKFYGLIEFPYPSGDGLHVGHIRSNTAMDIIARKRRAEGYNVLYPIGWDAFGLPTENYAIKTGKKPQDVTKKNTDTFRRQLKAGGFSFDWSREVNTTDPAYYKWTQWIFLQLFKKGLAYKKKMTINWCPKDLIGLANEEVVDGCCERCGTPVEKREKEQWMLAITKYADRLDKDLDTVDFLEKIKIQQRNWIGRSEGAEIEFAVKPEAEPTFYQFFDDSKIRENEPVVEREAICAIVKHWKEDKYLGLKWKKVDWDTFITGGVESGQTPEEAAMAEIREETGYQNIKLVKKLGAAHAKFYHIPKKQNRLAHFSLFSFELKDGEIKELSEEEKGNHTPVWLSHAQVESFRLPSSQRYAWELLKNNGKPKEEKIKVFTTRPDTLFGATYLVLSPEHPLVSHFIHQASNASEIDAYIKAATKKAEADRTAEGKEKTGVELKGIKAINPTNGEEIPVWISDYVLAGYGTGAIMAVPGHDERDFAFATKFKLPIREVVVPNVIDKRNPPVAGKKTVERRNVHPIVLDPKTGKYLGIRWKKHPWTTFPMGGVEEGEDIVAAARREVAEETGYTNLKLIRVLPGTVRAEYFAAHKDQNRVSYTNAVLFELAGPERSEVKQEEQDAHEVIWLTEADLRSDKMTHAEMGFWNEKRNPSYTSYFGEGYLINSGAMNSLTSAEAKKKIVEMVGGKIVTTYKLRDWVFSRQRYWGEPIPLIHCNKCGYVPVAEKELPVKLPPVKNYKPTETGESPLAGISKWVNVKCPKCKGKARRETDTMPNWAGSSWYYLRYADPKNKKELASKKNLKYFTPVDWYNGGMEHTTLHLLYSRFWHKFLFDIGVAPTSEPYMKRTSHGLILAEGGVKMSKSKGNVVNPDEIVKLYGADTLRVYEMFMGPFDQPVAWSTESIIGSRRFIERVWRLKEKASKKVSENSALESLVQKTILKVSEDIEAMRFNTAVSALMILVNEMEKADAVSAGGFKILLQLVAPFAPHIADELWNAIGGKNSIHQEKWPVADMKKISSVSSKIAVQVNGKVRAEMEIPAEASQDEIIQKALGLDEIAKWTAGRKIQRTIYVKGKLVSIVAI